MLIPPPILNAPSTRPGTGPGEQKFRVGVALIEQRLDPLVAARTYSDIADAVVTALARRAQAEFAMKHGDIDGGDPLVLAFGRYGGQALTEKSDLDLVFLFSGDHEARSDGQIPLTATTYFNRLFQRLVSALTVPTAAGPLYEVDTRLRPSGAQGLLAVSIDSFASYQRDTAWTWEHMALTRARLVFGHGHKDAMEAVITNALNRPRDSDSLRQDIMSMRADMDKAHPGEGPLDVKRGRGGLIDLEFLIHHMQLRHGTAFITDLRAALVALAGKDLMPSGLIPAHDLLARYLTASRLMDGVSDAKGNATTRALLAQICKMETWAALKAAILDARKTIAAEWKRQFERK